MDLASSQGGRALEAEVGKVMREDAKAVLELIPKFLNKKALSVLITMDQSRLTQDEKDVLAILAKHFVRGQNTGIQDPILHSLMQSIDREQRSMDDDFLDPEIRAAPSRTTGRHDNAEAQGGQTGLERVAQQTDVDLSTGSGKRTKPSALSVGFIHKKTNQSGPLGSKRPRGRPPKHPKANDNAVGGSASSVTSSDSWGALLRLKSLELNASFEKKLKEDQDGVLSVIRGDATMSLSLDSQVLENTSQLEKVLVCCARAKAEESMTAVQKVRWLFAALLVGDIKIALYGGGNLTKTHTEEIVRILARRHSQVVPHPGTSIPLGMNIEDVDRALTAGDHLAFLCNNLGTGCLFFLQDVLTPNFVLNRITKKGQAYQGAMARMKELGLGEKIQKTGVGRFGDSVRKHLREFHRVDDYFMDEGRAGRRISEVSSSNDADISNITEDMAM